MATQFDVANVDLEAFIKAEVDFTAENCQV